MTSLPHEEASDDDPSLLRRIERGDEIAMRIAYRRHAKTVRAAARRVLGSTADVEEVALETFFILWRKARVRDVEVHRGSLAPWLITTANYAALTRRRSLLRRRKHEAYVEEVGREDIGVDEVPDLDLVRALAALDPVDRQLVEMCLASGTSYKEAARDLGLTHAAVRNRLSRAKARLRTILTPVEKGYDDGSRA